MKEQIKSVNEYVDRLQRQVSVIKDDRYFWISKSNRLEDAVKERDEKIENLRSKQETLQKKISLIPPNLLVQLEAEERERRRQLKLLKRKGGLSR